MKGKYVYLYNRQELESIGKENCRVDIIEIDNPSMSATVIGYYGQKYLAIVYKDGYGIREMYCLEHYDYEIV